MFPPVFQKSVDTLEQLREIKGELDGSAKNFDSPQICEDCLIELKQQVLMHTPSSVSSDNRDRFKDLINKTFEGRFVNQKSMKTDIK